MQLQKTRTWMRVGRIGAQVSEFMIRHFSRHSITWQESVGIFLPLMAEHLVVALLSLLSAVVVGPTGVPDMAAVVQVDALNTFLNVFYLGVSIGASVIVANYRGRDDGEKLYNASIQAVITVTLFSILTMAVVMVLNEPFLQLLFGTREGTVVEAAKPYLLSTSLTLPIVGVTASICGVLRGIGEGRTALTFTLASTLKYVILDSLALRIFGMGVPGRVLAITVSRLLDVPLLRWCLNRSYSGFVFHIEEFFNVNLAIIRNILRLGLPCAGEMLCVAGGALLVRRILSAMLPGNVFLYNTAVSIITLSQVLLSALHAAVLIITGVCIGARRERDARGLTRSYFVLGVIISLISAALTLSAMDDLMTFYEVPRRLTRIVYNCVLAGLVAQPLIYNLAFLLPGVLISGGDSKFCAVASVVVMLVCEALGGWIFGVRMDMALYGVWGGLMAGWLARAVIFFIRMRGRKWVRYEMFEE